MAGARAAVTAVALVALAIGAAAPAAAEPGGWRIDVGGAVDVTPKWTLSVSPGLSTRATRRVTTRIAVGARLDLLLPIALGEREEYDVHQVDLVVAMRVARAGAANAFDLGVGVSRYGGRVNIPYQPDCWGCGRYGDVSYNPVLQLGFTHDVRVGGGWIAAVGARAVLVPAVVIKTDAYGARSSPIGLRLDVALASRS